MPRDLTSEMHPSYPTFVNDRALHEIGVGAKEFNCIGASPPDNHPHIYLTLAEADSVICPHCGTQYVYDRRLGPDEADPAECAYIPDIVPEQISPADEIPPALREPKER